MTDIEKMIKSAPITLSDDERRQIEELTRTLGHRLYSDGVPYVGIMINSVLAPALHAVLLVGLAAIENGAAGIDLDD